MNEIIMIVRVRKSAHANAGRRTARFPLLSWARTAAHEKTPFVTHKVDALKVRKKASKATEQ